mmetsp:Transcript_12993/g.38168  ORF Transcript_12993/g.38168 Transcript_12993/m.38168 type:complete len:267 (-) Transcript_12993:52-852(-)
MVQSSLICGGGPHGGGKLHAHLLESHLCPIIRAESADGDQRWGGPAANCLGAGGFIPTRGEKCCHGGRGSRNRYWNRFGAGHRRIRGAEVWVEISILGGSSAVLGCFPMWVLINTVDASSSAMYTIAVSVLAGLGSGVTGPIVKSTLQNVTLPNARGQAFAFLNIFDDFGRGLGPVFVATMITSFGGRTPAFNVGVSGWLFCGVLNACIFFTFRSDEERMRRDLTAGMLRAERNCGEMIIEDQHPSVEIGSNKDSKHDVVPLLVLT